MTQVIAAFPTVEDVRNITKTFDMLHPRMSSAIAFDNVNRELKFYLAKGKNVMTNLFHAFTRSISYDEILDNSDPLRFVKARLDQAYFEFAMTDPKCGPDLTGIVQEFTKSHPDVQVHFHVVNELDAIKLRVKTNNELRVDRMINRTDILSLEEPVPVITTILEGAYNELMRRKTNKQEDKTMPTKGKSITDAIAVDNDFMMKMAKCAVAAWHNMHNGPRKIKPEDVYVVWFCKTLQNWKALCSTLIFRMECTTR